MSILRENKITDAMVDLYYALCAAGCSGGAHVEVSKDDFDKILNSAMREQSERGLTYNGHTGNTLLFMGCIRVTHG